MDAYYAALKIVHVYGAVSVLPFRCVYPHFLLELFHVQRLDLFWHTGSWAPLVSACSDYSFSNSPVFDWVTRGLQLWERNDGLVVNVSNSWQLLFVRGRASQDEQVATAYLPMLLGRTPPTSLPFSETRFYVWTCIFAYTHNSKKKKKIPFESSCSTSQTSCLCFWCTLSRGLAGPGTWPTYLPLLRKSELGWEDSLHPE